MSKSTTDETGVPVRVDEVRYPDGVPVALPAEPEDVPESPDSGSKSGQKAATQKREG